MTPAAILTLAGGLLLWPTGPAPTRMRRGWAASGSSAAATAGSGPLRVWTAVRAGRRPPPALMGPAVVAVGAAAAGIGGVVAAGLLAVTAARVRRAARRTHERTATTRALAEALGSFSAELRAGSPPASAARAAARDGDPRCAHALRLIEATARLGGDVPTALRAAASDDPVAGDELRRLAAAWALADRHGIGLAGLADAVTVDLRARARFAGALAAQVAGPRATAGVLAVLPVLGIGLGEGIGARPWAVLSGSVPGQVLLVVGVALLAAGVEWTERIVAGVAR